MPSSRLTVARLVGATTILTACGRGPPAEHKPDTTRSSVSTDTAPLIAAIDSGIITRGEIALGDSVFNGRGDGGNCAPCHGRNGVGTEAAPDLTDQQWINGDGSIGFIKGTVYQGVQQPVQHPLPMPPFGYTLTERQLQAVAAYVYALNHGGRR